jgi:hypothetical protein
MGSSPQYPIVLIPSSDVFSVMEAPDWRCTTLGWRNGFFEDLQVFDSAGRLWPTSVQLDRPIGVLDRLFNRKRRVQVSFDPPREEALPLVIPMLEKLVDRHPDGLYDQFLTHDELKARFRSAKTPVDLIELVRTLGGEDDSENEIR